MSNPAVTVGNNVVKSVIKATRFDASMTRSFDQRPWEMVLAERATKLQERAPDPRHRHSTPCTSNEWNGRSDGCSTSLSEAAAHARDVFGWRSGQNGERSILLEFGPRTRLQEVGVDPALLTTVRELRRC